VGYMFFCGLLSACFDFGRLLLGLYYWFSVMKFCIFVS